MLKTSTILLTAVAILFISGCVEQNDTIVSADALKPQWAEICKIGNRKTHLLAKTWNRDKYPDAPTLSANSKVTLIDQDGPGVVTQLHVSDYRSGQVSDKVLILSVWYDNEVSPAIKMPLMDFMGDIESATEHYQTIYFSHVQGSHNFRLPMPFTKHIRIEVENPTDHDFMGYMELQWDEVEDIPSDWGYLKVDYQSGNFQFPQQDLVLLDIASGGSIVAHWLQLEADHKSCANGQGICEANHEIYLDGDKAPTIESLGTEDFYGHSWGFRGVESDSYSAIVRYEQLPKGGTRVAMVRARDIDKITFRKSCKVLFTYKHDLYGHKKDLLDLANAGGIETPYHSCIYYYAKNFSFRE